MREESGPSSPALPIRRWKEGSGPTPPSPRGKGVGGLSSPGLVFNVQGYSLHDGPGIRTVIFLKGCPLRCLWCCNPESQSSEPEVEHQPLDCIRCGRCLAACPRGAINWTAPHPPAPSLGAERGPGGEIRIDRTLCDGCRALTPTLSIAERAVRWERGQTASPSGRGRPSDARPGEGPLCVRACPSGALRAVGERLTVEEALARVRRDAPFYRRSGGGVTLSGGEPLAQWRFARALAQACYEENVSVVLETTGCASWDAFAAVLEFTDLVLYDLKHTDDAAHRAGTGVGSALILANLRRLADRGVPFILRLPLIPDYNLEAGHLRAAAGLAAELGAREVHLMPFHQLAREKYRRLGRPYALADLPGLRDTVAGREEIERARRIVEEFGVPVAVGG